jgi:hypothetical protein
MTEENSNTAWKLSWFLLSHQFGVEQTSNQANHIFIFFALWCL